MWSDDQTFMDSDTRVPWDIVKRLERTFGGGGVDDGSGHLPRARGTATAGLFGQCTLG